MIEFKTGNLLNADVEALVNTVNCVGVMGKGIALQFKQAYPDNYREYEKVCRVQELQPGKMATVRVASLTNPKYIINFPTKVHWKGKSRLEYIKTGLEALITEIRELGITSIAVPPLGCGNGGLQWSVVRPMIEEAFEQVPEVEIWLYPPDESPEPDQMKIGTQAPNLTKARAIFILLMESYVIPGYKLSLLEIQKLAYFLQIIGEPLKLDFKAGKYGPYAENLNHVLQRLEGHYIRGYGDRSRDAELYLLPGASERARDVLSEDQHALRRLEDLKTIIEGFETPYGMELLATVHWVCDHHPGVVNRPHEVIRLVHEWNERKRKIFKPGHIVVAVDRLKGTLLTG